MGPVQKYADALLGIQGAGALAKKATEKKRDEDYFEASHRTKKIPDGDPPIRCCLTHLELTPTPMTRSAKISRLNPSKLWLVSCRALLGGAARLIER